MDVSADMFLTAGTRFSAYDAQDAPYLTVHEAGAYRGVTLFLGEAMATDPLAIADAQLDRLEAAIATARHYIAAHRRAEANGPDDPDDEPTDEPETLAPDVPPGLTAADLAYLDPAPSVR